MRDLQQSEIKAYAKKVVARQKAAANILSDRLRSAQILMKAQSEKIDELFKEIEVLHNAWPKDSPMRPIIDPYRDLSVSEKLALKAERDEKK